MKISKILLLCVVLSFFGWGTAFADIKASIYLPSLEADIGEQVQVPITVSTNEAIGIAQFVVDYNNTVLTFVSASIGSDVPGFMVSNVNPNLPFSPATPGTNKNVLVQVSGGGSNSFTGNNKQVVVLRFTVIGAGGSSSPLAFDQNGSRTYLSTIGLYDIKGSEIDFNNGSLDVVSSNIPPTASNLILTPASPKTADNLVGSYTYSDADSDPESGTEIRWYKNGSLQSSYNNQLTVPASATAKGEQWYFTVRPKDGKEFGTLQTSGTVTIGNTAPIASNLTISPASPKTGDNLVGSYSYSDADSDPQSGSEIRWYKNGSLQSSYNEQLTVPASATTKGEQWYFTARPGDGSDFGTLQTSDPVTIGNTAPVASNLAITPASPFDPDNLIGSYSYSDADGDTQSGSEIRWYKNGTNQAAYNDVLTIPASATTVGDQWYFTVKPRDGAEFGTLQTSGTVTISKVNTPPTASNVALAPASPKTADNLVGSYAYSDADSDPESGTEIRWYKNGSLQSSYNNQLTVPASATTKGEQWHFTVRPKDGKDFGSLVQSNTVTIANTAPAASNLSITPSNPLDADNLVGSYSYSDADSDPQSGSEIRWYKNGAVQAAYNDVSTIPASATTIGDQWHFTVRPKDGTDFGVLQTSATVTVSNTFFLTVNVDPAGTGTVTKDPDKTSYNQGEQVTLTASPNAGYVFDHWSGDESGTNRTITITMDANKTATAHFKLINYVVMITVDPTEGGTVAKNPDKYTYMYGEQVTLTATPSQEYEFDHWSGDASGTNPVVTMTINSDKDVTSHFRLKTYTLTIAMTPSGTGTVAKNPDKTLYDHGEQVTLTATPGSGFEFSHWSGDASGTNPTVTITMTAEKNVTANFKAIATYSLIVNIDPAGGGSVTKNPDKAYYQQGEQVTLTAAPNTGYVFDYWSGDASGTNPTVTLTMNSNKTVTAHFKLKTYTLTVTVAPTGSGSATKNPDKANYNHGEQVTLTATPNAGYEFVNWSGDATGTNPTVTITMNSNKNVTANFKVKTYTITIIIDPASSGTVAKNPEKASYNYGDQVTLTATPNTGYEFDRWSGDTSGTAPMVTIAMNGNKNVTAHFKAKTYTLTLVINPVAGGTVTKNPDKAAYPHGEQVTLAATPNPGYHFVNWSGDATGTNSPVTIAMISNKQVAANFAVVVQEKKLHVKSIIVTKEKLIKFVCGKAEVLIVDTNGAPVEAATVIGQWSRRANDRDTLVTKNDGWGETFSNWSVTTRRLSQEFTFKIIDVKKDGWIYDSAANEINYGSTDGQLDDLHAENSHHPQLENLSAGKYAWNSPNPFNPKTTISFFLPQAARVKVEIYNILGKKIATLLDGHAAAGVNSVDWSARDDDGFDVTSGTYFYRISIENEEPIIQKILLLK